MKNIHIIPTHKPSKIGYIFESESYYIFTNGENPNDINDNLAYYRHIYITSDEDINENDYIITKDGRLVEVSYLLSKDLESASKIILTTDQDLIKDGVQAIDDEFLEWFVKNPSCKWVEINKTAPIRPFGSLYIIIVPNTTQEIIDEDFSGGLEMGQIIPKEERSYSEEDMIKAVKFGELYKSESSKSLFEKRGTTPTEVLKKWFNEFKNK